MYGGKIFSRIFLFPDELREAVVWNYSCWNALQGTVLHRMVAIHRENGKPIRAYAERFHFISFHFTYLWRVALQ